MAWWEAKSICVYYLNLLGIGALSDIQNVHIRLIAAADGRSFALEHTDLGVKLASRRGIFFHHHHATPQLLPLLLIEREGETGTLS